MEKNTSVIRWLKVGMLRKLGRLNESGMSPQRMMYEGSDKVEVSLPSICSGNLSFYLLVLSCFADVKAVF